MAKYRLKNGKIHGKKDGQRHVYRKGDTIELNSDQAKYKMDALEPLEPLEREEERHSAPRTQLKAVYRDDGKYDVFNVAVEVPVNDVPLTKKEARALVDGGNLEDLDKEEKPKIAKEEDVAPELKEEIETPLKLKVVHKGGGKYNVVNDATGKPVNDTLLTKTEAMDLAEEKEKVDDKQTDTKDLAKVDGVHTRRRSKSK